MKKTKNFKSVLKYLVAVSSSLAIGCSYEGREEDKTTPKNTQQSHSIGTLVDIDNQPNEVLKSVLTSGTLIGITAFAEDIDDSDRVNYQLIDSADNRFQIDPVSGVVSVDDLTKFNAEIDASHTIKVLATSSDKSTSHQDFIIKVIAEPVNKDNQPPSIPENLQAQVISAHQINLSWSASSDDTEVTGYKIFRDKDLIATTSNLDYSDSALMASTQYSYQVQALDAASKTSNLSMVATATTSTSVQNPASGTVGPLSINQDSDDGYSFGKYGSADWETNEITTTYIRFGSAGNENRDYISSFMFRDVTISADQNILSAKLIFTKDKEQFNDEAVLDLSIKGIDPSSQSTFSENNLGQDRGLLPTNVRWEKSATSWETNDISSIVQNIVNHTHWQSGQAMGFVIQNSPTAAGDNRHSVYSANSAYPPQLVITYGPDIIAPELSRGSPKSNLPINTTSTVISVVTNELASCKYSDQPNTDYVDMSQSLTGDGFNHQASVDNLSAEDANQFYLRCEDEHNNSNTNDYLIRFLVNNINSPLFDLSINEPAGVARDNQVVRSGVPFPKGLLSNSEQLTLVQGQNTLPLQSRPLSLWDDGSVRWLLMDTQLDVNANQNHNIEVKFTNTSTPVANPITIDETTEFIHVDTGPLQFSVPKNYGGIIHSATVDGINVISPPGGKSTDRGPWISHNGTQHFASLLTNNSTRLSNDPIKLYEDKVAYDWGQSFHLNNLWDLSVKVEEDGELHTVIRVSGTHLDASGMGYSSFVSRIHAYRGQRQLKFDHTLIFTGTGSDNVTDYGFRLPYTGTSTLIEGVDSDTGSVIHLDYESHSVAGSSRQGQALGYINRQNDNSSVVVTLQEMAENYPKALAATSEGIEIQLYPSSAPPMELARYSQSIDTENGETGSITRNRGSQGFSKTDRFVIQLSSSGIDQNTSENLAKAVDKGQLMALASPTWYSDAKVMGIGAFDFDPSLENSELHYRIDRNLHIIADFMRFNQRQQFNWFGMFNYGDIRGFFSGGCNVGHAADCTWSKKGRYGWSGNSGEPSNQLWVQYLRKPTRDGFIDAVALAKHTQDQQMVHFGDAALNNDSSIAGGRNRESAVGSLHRHGVQAWSGYAGQPEYSHISGVETYYYLTGDGRAKEALFEAGAFMAQYSSGEPSHTAFVNGIDLLSRVSAVFYDEADHYQYFNDRLQVLLNYAYNRSPNLVYRDISDSSLGGTFDYFMRGAPGLLYHHERTGDERAAGLIFDAADITTQGGDKWGVGSSGEVASVWYYLNSLTYAASIAAHYDKNPTPYYSLANQVLILNGHEQAQDGASAIPLSALEAIPDDWRNWIWEFEQDAGAPKLLFIDRQLTYKNNFMQDYHSYRAFIHLAAAAALIAPDE